jgi:hypothetical protein
MLWGFDVFIDSDLKPWVIEARQRLSSFLFKYALGIRRFHRQ